ncbi:MAG: BamA/TamA family outer membrane protein, partial [bacterium]
GNESVYNQDLITPKTPSFISRTYYQYVFTYPQFALDLSYKFFREKMSIYAGLGIERASIDPLTKDRTSKIFTEQPFGYSGGKANYIKGGIRYDGRDYPLNPSKGIVLSGTYTNHAKFLDSDFNYSSVDLTYIGFFSFLKYFVIGHRVMIDQMWGTLPFFALAEFNSYDNYQGLGGQDTLRGAPTFRFIDNLKFVSQLELRTRFYNGSVFGQHMELFLIPYWDIGRVWDRQKRVTFDQMHNAFGNEFRFTWNTTFIASFTMGFSSNNFSTYLTFGESFN